jgi:2-polyprenyl-3-methyl-5-hydroxy-6-metoxy-1,4-benzoquinol methylase
MSDYYRNVNLDLLNRIPEQATSVLEIGCGSGWLGAAFKAKNPSCQYFGIEILEECASEAAMLLDKVICANIEDDLTIPLEFAPSFDVLVFGDVLEHLLDPWLVLSQLRQYIKPGGSCVVCIPNVGHWSVITSLLSGKWDYQDSGLLDRTHLRFFTISTIIDMFQRSGWTVVDLAPRDFWPDKTEQALKTLLPAAIELGADQETARLNMSAFQWLVRAKNG